MKNWFRFGILSLLFLVAMNFSSFAQEEMKMEKHYKNVVRLNLTNPVIFGEKSLVLGYERVLGDYKSASINIGQAQLPKLSIVNTDSTEIHKDSKEHGFNMTADFRFYLQKENKHFAPRGVYLGPYFGYNSMGRENTWTLNTSSFQGEVKTDVDFNVLAIGGQMGYQFVLFKRLTLDLVLIGPGVAFYNLKAKLNTTLDAEDEQALYDKINEALKERFPGYTFTIDDVDFAKKGSSSVTSIGFRYVVNVGFMF